MTDRPTPSGDGRARPHEHVELEVDFDADAERPLDDSGDDEPAGDIGQERDIPIEAPIADAIDQQREVELDDEYEADRE